MWVDKTTIWRFSWRKYKEVCQYEYEPGLPSSSFHLSGPSNSHTQFFLPSDLVHPKFQVCYCPSYDGPVDGSVVACDDAPSASCEVNSWVWSARSKSLGCPKRMVFWIQIYRLPLQRGLEARVGTVVFFNRGHRIHSAGWCGLLLAPSCLRLGI